jgi:hypothetical protein
VRISVRQTTFVSGVFVIAVLAGAGAADAQQELVKTGFVAVNFGAQSTQRELATSQTSTIYDETATITSSQPIHNGPILEIGGGYRVRPNVTVGARFSTFGFGRTSESTVVASIPDPVAYNRPKTVTQTTPDLTHSEQGIHIQATWFKAVTPRIDVSLSGGPSFIHVSQQLTANITVPTGTQTITVTKETQTGTAIGFNAGFDGAVMVNPQYGVGLFVRYTQGTVDLPAVTGLKVGGLQSGLGLRVRF